MNEYTVYFELFGKKMKTDVLAESKEHAENIIRNKIVFHKTIQISDGTKQAKQAFDDLLNIFRRFKP